MTNYEQLMKEMTPEIMCAERVKMITVNQSELFYVTSRGQLYNLDNLQGAMADEYRWLMTNIPENTQAKVEENTKSTEDDNQTKSKK